MERLPVTRRMLARELVVTAAVRPLNVGVGLAVLAAALVLQTWWLVPVALLVYVGMVWTTLFDADRAERVGRQVYERARRPSASDVRPPLAPEVTAKLELAHTQERRIRKAIAAAPSSLGDLGDEIDRLMTALDQLARRADHVHAYLRDEDPKAIRERVEQLRGDDAYQPAIAALEEQLAAIEQLERQVARFDAQMEHIVATLGTIHAQVVRMSVEEEAAAQGRVAEQVRDLRREVGAAADALQEAYDDLE
jgi:type IV secretory pathway TrbD component